MNTDLKKNRFRWKRVRTSVHHKRDEHAFAHAAQDIEQFEQEQRAGRMDVLYGDESGCSLQPHIPSAYQPIGETITIPSSQSKRVNMLGFFKTTNQLESLCFEGNINADIVVKWIDEFSHHLVTHTVVMLDHSSLHRSKKVEAHVETWKARG